MLLLGGEIFLDLKSLSQKLNCKSTYIAEEKKVITVLKLGHHGSAISSTEEYLEAISPEVAVYMAGRGNVYGHPDEEVLNRLSEMGIKVYGTDVNGSIVITTDGKSYLIETER